LILPQRVRQVPVRQQRCASRRPPPPRRQQRISGTCVGHSCKAPRNRAGGSV